MGENTLGHTHQPHRPGPHRWQCTTEGCTAWGGAYRTQRDAGSALESHLEDVHGIPLRVATLDHLTQKDNP